jgi:tetratricopeptide (TPR) repeat protein
MRRSFRWQLTLLLFTAGAAQAQVPGSPDSTQTPPPPSGPKQEVTISASPLDQDVARLPPHEFTKCMSQNGGNNPASSDLTNFYLSSAICEEELSREKHLVIEACINRDGKTPPAVAAQACTDSIDNEILQGGMRFYLYASRAAAYFAGGDKQHALADYNEALRIAPQNAYLYYNRGVFYSAESDPDAALRDFDTSIGINAKFVPALRQRARIYQARGNFAGALADYSEALRLEPKTAALWCERGYVSLRQQDFAGAVRDEAQAIELDAKLARAYYFRASALVNLGDAAKGINDLQTAVQLDPTLAALVKIQGKNASLTLPPL